CPVTDLKRLDDQFDFPYTSCPQLNVSSGLPPIGDLAIHSCFHVAHFCQGLEIERRLVNKRSRHFQEPAAKSSAPRDRPGFQQSEPLPRSHSRPVVTRV